MDETITQIAGIRFNDPGLLQRAFTHRSYLNESKEVKESNERLEFLGDAVLSFIVSSHLYKVRPRDSEGDLTNLRAYIVKTKSLAEAAQKLDLGKYLYLSKGEEQGGGRVNPQLLANTFEALLGAIFVDQGTEAAKKVVSEVLLPLFQNELELGAPQDAKSMLQELMQEREKHSPIYRILSTAGPDHAKRFVVGVYVSGRKLGQGAGYSKQEAEELSAKAALKGLS